MGVSRPMRSWMWRSILPIFPNLSSRAKRRTRKNLATFPSRTRPASNAREAPLTQQEAGCQRKEWVANMPFETGSNLQALY
eukprot:4575148-Amphidinium_carterae.1